MLAEVFLYQVIDQKEKWPVLSSNPDNIENITVDSTFGLPSDHYCVYFDLLLNFKLINSPVKKTFDFANADFNSFRNSLNDNPLFVPLNTSTDMALNTWKIQFLAAINFFVPKREIKVSRRAPWISYDIIYAIKNKKTFWGKKVRGLSDPKVLEAFLLLRQRIKNRICSSR